MQNLRQRWARLRPQPGTFKDSAVAAIPRTAAAIPDGMASAALIGVNPIHGLYAGLVGPIVGGLTSSTQLMVVTTTSAAALAAYSALQPVPADNRLASLFVMTLLAGVLMVVAGFIGLGRLTAFVSHSVMTGFLTGVAVSILLGQIPALVGMTSDAGTSAGKALDVLSDLGGIDLPSFLIGAAALVILVTLRSTSWGKYAALIALIGPSIVVALAAYFDGVSTVADTGEIVRGLPSFVLPPLGAFSLTILAGAFSVAAIVLVQGAGVAQSYPNPDRSRTNQNTDFMAQGWANVGSGLLGGVPVGSSVSQTALSVSLGARDRWAGIMSGVWLAAVLALLSGLAGEVATPTLAAILIMASLGAIRPEVIRAVWQSGPQAKVAMITTFTATLLLPVAAAVGIGVALSFLLNINREALDVRIVELVAGEDGRVFERPAPPVLRSNQIVVLNVYGSLFYAGARTFESILPRVVDAEKPVVIVRIRGRTVIGATAFSILSGYAALLEERGGRLYLSGVAPELLDKFKASGRVNSGGPIHYVEATPTLGESTRAAIADAEAFLLGEAPVSSDPAEPPPSWAARVGAKVSSLWKHET